MNDFIQVENCIEGGIYKLRSRNLALGVFNPENNNGFIGIREKFNYEYLFTEYHYDNGPPFGTVRPIEQVDEIDQDKIALSERVGRSFCNRCGEFIGQEKIQHDPVRYRRFHLRFPDNPAPIECTDEQAQPVFRRQNDLLFNKLLYLEEELELR